MQAKLQQLPGESLEVDSQRIYSRTQRPKLDAPV
jgi:hypothetical protein